MNAEDRAATRTIARQMGLLARSRCSDQETEDPHDRESDNHLGGIHQQVSCRILRRVDVVAVQEPELSHVQGVQWAVPDVRNAARLSEADADMPTVERLRHLPFLYPDFVRWRAEVIAEIF